MENGTHRVYNFTMDTLDSKYLWGKLDFVFKSLKRAAKFKVAFGFGLKNVEDGSLKYFLHTKVRTLLERSKPATIIEDLTKIKSAVTNTDVIESCTREWANTKLKLYKLTNVKKFATIFKEDPMCCNDTVLPNPHLKNHSVKCLTYKMKIQKPHDDNICLFRALALHLNKNERLKSKTSSLFSLFLKKNWWNWSCKPSRCLYGSLCNSGGNCSSRYFLVSYWHCRRIYAWGACEEESGETL